MKILFYPDSRLIKKNELILSYTKEHAEQVAEMFKLMYKHKGVGLAAPQVGNNLRLFITNVTGKKEDERIYINPEIKLNGDQTTGIEGCLSFPGIAAWIKRYDEVEISAINISGDRFTENLTGLAARAIQHEQDHIDGILIIEKMTPADLRRNNRIIRALQLRNKQID